MKDKDTKQADREKIIQNERRKTNQTKHVENVTSIVIAGILAYGLCVLSVSVSVSVSI